MILYEEDIQKLISNDLILRHFYQNGVIEYNLKSDSYIEKALELLNDSNQYNDLLSRSNKYIKLPENDIKPQPGYF